MNVNVTRRYKGKKDTKGNVISSYNYNGGSNSTVNLKSAPVDGEEVYADPLKTTLNEFKICLNFVDVIPYEYKCPEDMIILEQEYENGEASILIGPDAYVLGDLLLQYTLVTFIPSVSGVVLFTCKIKA